MKFLLKGEETDRLLFRWINQGTDFDTWLKFFEDPITSLHWKEERESPVETCEKWYQKQRWRYSNDKGGMNALIEKKSGRLVGHCGLLVQTVDEMPEIEIGYSLLPEFWNKGYAIEAANHCRQFAFKNHLADSLISIISLTNIPSQRVAIKNGMIIEKKTVYHGNQVYIFRIKAPVL